MRTEQWTFFSLSEKVAVGRMREKALGQAVIDALLAKGHTVEIVNTLGAAQSIGLGQDGKAFRGSPDPRGRGAFTVRHNE